MDMPFHAALYKYKKLRPDSNISRYLTKIVNRTIQMMKKKLGKSTLRFQQSRAFLYGIILI